MMISAVDEIFIRLLHNKYMGYGKQNTLQLIMQMYITYANISMVNLQKMMQL